jgi:Transposase DDE domain group 1
VRLLHSLAKTHASFDDPNLVSHAGLVPVMALAQRAGLGDLVAGHVRPGGQCGVNPAAKVPCLVAGMAAGADSIDDMDLLRHGAMTSLFGGIRAPSTLGSHLRSYTWGNVAQLERAGREFLANLAGQAPLLPGADVLAFIDIDSMQKRVYGHKKQGARFGHTKIQGKSLLVRGLNALAAVISTPLSAPVIAATRLRGGNAASARGAASMAARAITTARGCGCTGMIIVRMDSAFYNAAVIGAIRGQGARFSVTAPMNASIRAAIAAIGEDAWTPVQYPRAIRDDQLEAWISDAEVAEAQYTAFASKIRPGGHRPADRPPGPRPEQESRGQAGRAVPRLALPRRVHRLALRAGPGRGPAPRPRGRGAGLRRRHQRPARSYAVRGFYCERRVARHRGHGAQPGPRRRGPGIPALREGPGRDHPP